MGRTRERPIENAGQGTTRSRSERHETASRLFIPLRRNRPGPATDTASFERLQLRFRLGSLESEAAKPVKNRRLFARPSEYVESSPGNRRVQPARVSRIRSDNREVHSDSYNRHGNAHWRICQTPGTAVFKKSNLQSSRPLLRGHQ